MKSNVVCIGAYPALQRTMKIPVFRPGEVNRLQDVCVSVAGKAVNTARVVQRMGGLCRMTGFAGDNSADRFFALLRAEGLPVLDWVQTALPLRVCQTVVPTDGGAFTELIEEGPDLPSAEWLKLVQRARQLLTSHPDALSVCSGTMPPHTPTSFYAEVISGFGQRVILDTSGPALLEALPAQPLLVKINAAELCRSVGMAKTTDQGALRAAARQLLLQGAAAVGITLGPDPAWLFTPDACWQYPLPRVPVASALGSGDSVNAGIALGLLDNRPIEQAFAFGLACGCANAETTNPGMVAPARVQELARQISPQPLA